MPKTDRLVQFQGVQHEQDLEHGLLQTPKVLGTSNNIRSQVFVGIDKATKGKSQVSTGTDEETKGKLINRQERDKSRASNLHAWWLIALIGHLNTRAGNARIRTLL
jgi:hypothetical protein